MSTVFEPECWTLSPRNLLNGKDGDTGYLGKVDEPDFLNMHLLNNEETENELTSREVNIADTQTDNHFLPSDFDTDRKYLLNLLPQTLYLPTEPLKLSKDDELKLIRVLNKEMQGVHQNQLREIYTVLSAIDHKLTGWCSFQHLSFALTKKNVNKLAIFFASHKEQLYFSFCLSKLLILLLISAFCLTLLLKSMDLKIVMKYFPSSDI